MDDGSKSAAWIRFAAVLATVAAALLLTLAVEPLLNREFVTLFFLVAVVVSSWVAGSAGGVVSALAAVTLLDVFVIPPRNSLRIEGQEDFMRLGLFVLVSAALVYGVSRQRRAVRDIARSRAESQSLAERLKAEADERASAELRAANEFALRETVLSGIPDSVILTDKEGVIQYANLSACNVLECEPDDCVGKPLREMVSIHDETSGERLEPLAYAVLENGKPLHDGVARSLRRASGTEVPMEVSAYPIRDAKGELSGAVTIQRDVGERRKAARALRQTEEKFRLAVEAAKLGVWVWDPQTDSVVWSETLCEMLGYGSEAYEGSAEKFYVRIHPEDRERVRSELAAAAQRRGVFYSEFRIETPAGEAKWLIGHGCGFYDSKTGALTTFAGVNIDITERRLAEERIQQLNHDLESLALQLGSANQDLMRHARELERVDEEKSKFLSSMSHELRTPLNTICGFIELLLEQDAGPLNARQLRYLTNMEMSARQLLRVVNDVLDLSRIAAGRLEIVPELFPLRGLAEEVVASFAPMAEEHEVNVAVDVPEELRLFADRGRMKQVLDNLLSNAIKFTPPAGSVGIHALESESGIEVTVVDTGVGIPGSEIDTIFAEFKQVHREGFRPRVRGSGLGLAITRKLVELQGAGISVSSVEGAGTTFRIFFPPGKASNPRSAI